MLRKLGENAATVVDVGIDVSQDTFDVATAVGERHYTGKFPLSKNGVNDFRNWLVKCGARKVHAWMEATGRYSQALAKIMHGRGWLVTILNPRCVRQFASSKLKLNKTDRLDAKAILRFAQASQPNEYRLWEPPSATMQELRDLQLELQAVKKWITQQRNRLKCGLETQSVRKVIENNIKQHLALQKQLEAECMRVIRSDEQLLQRYKRLFQINGFGKSTVPFLLAKIDWDAFSKGRQLVKYAGLDSVSYDSGTSIHRQARISKCGHSDLRAALYWCAVTAIRTDPSIAEFAAAIAERRKSKMVAICAVMAKLLRIAFAVVRSDRNTTKHNLIAA